MINLIVKNKWNNSKKIYGFENFNKAWRVYRQINISRCIVYFIKSV